MDRYHRQILLPQIAEQGQQRLAASRILLIGCGALGTVMADQLVRAGVALLRICDRDIIELTNLQRQVLFDQTDAMSGSPKAIVAARKLKEINSQVEIEPSIVDVHSGNIEELMEGIDLVLDGTDNAETRYLINDAAVKHGVPWVYGGCVGTQGQVMGIIPKQTACLRCVFPQPPGPGELPTCDTAGVLAAAAAIVASLQVVEAMKILLYDPGAATELTRVQVWPTRVTSISLADARRDDCPACARREFPFLQTRPGATATSLCGRNTVQIRPSAPIDAKIDFDSLLARLESAGQVQRHPSWTRCELRESGLSITVFYDGRALVHGTSDPAVARSIYAKFVGS